MNSHSRIHARYSQARRIQEPAQVFFLICIGLATFLLTLGLMSFAIVAPATVAQAAPPVEELKVIYGFDREFPPYSFEYEGDPTGFDVEIVKAIFDVPGVKLVYRPLAWDKVQLQLSAGNVHLTSGMAKTKQRMLLYDFTSRSVLPLNVKLFTKGMNRVGNVDLLRGKTVSVPKGSFYQRIIEGYGGFNVKLYRNELDALKALHNDDVEVFCGGDKTAYYYIRKLRMPDISAVGTPIRVTRMYYAVNKDHNDILTLANEGLRRIMENGEYDRIYRKWFVQELAAGERDKLVRSARDARVNAYAPYSKQATAAAILTQSGRIYTGVSIENSLPNLTVSALKVAVYNAVSDGETELRAAVSVTPDGQIIPPTADERQVLYEFGRGVLAVTEPVKGTFVDRMMSDLLPFAHSSEARDEGGDI